MSFELTNQVQSTKFQMVIYRRHVLNHKPRLAFESCRSVVEIQIFYVPRGFVVCSVNDIHVLLAYRAVLWNAADSARPSLTF